MANLYDFDVAFDHLSAFISAHGMESGISEIDKLVQIVNVIATSNDNMNKVHRWLFDVENCLNPLAAQPQTTTATASTQVHSWFDAGERMIKTMEAENENQRRAVDQIEDGCEVDRLW